MIYISHPQKSETGRLQSYITSDISLNELKDFAIKLKVRKDQIRGNKIVVGFSKYKQAIKLGAIEVNNVK